MVKFLFLHACRHHWARRRLKFYALSVGLWAFTFLRLLIYILPVRETLSQDLIERFIVDILEITEQLLGKARSFPIE